MTEYPREAYVKKLLDRRGNELIKIIIGARRSGKSYIMNQLFYRRLIALGTDPDCILRFAFDSDDDLDLLDRYLPEEPTKIPQKRGGYLVNSRKFRAFVRDRVGDRSDMIFLLDEVQMLDGFAGTLNGLQRHPGYDIYVSGSNSRFLSSDIATEFRGRGSVIQVFPLTFSEFVAGNGQSPEDAWKDYIETGGIPIVAKMSSRQERMDYLKRLCEETYIKDIVNRNNLKDTAALSDTLDVIASDVGCLVNPARIADTFGTVLRKGISDDTVSDYIGYLEQAFLLDRAKQYDVKGRRYIGTPYKIYFDDLGVRNARLNFRQTEEPHLMENVIYNELRYRGFSVDVGRLDVNERSERKDRNGHYVYDRKSLEIDFVASAGDRRYYIQSALSMEDQKKRDGELKPLRIVDDSFTKIVITKNRLNPSWDDSGILTMDLFDFLLNPGRLTDGL
ncbi:MAG: ATP-binding protein [Candidatus Methanomethylophilaceae archaeon]|nr:ATP-binding protein [Candidatus Methanomethylophilaceae archaeon]